MPPMSPNIRAALYSPLDSGLYDVEQDMVKKIKEVFAHLINKALGNDFPKMNFRTWNNGNPQEIWSEGIVIADCKAHKFNGWDHEEYFLEQYSPLTGWLQSMHLVHPNRILVLLRSGELVLFHKVLGDSLPLFGTQESADAELYICFKYNVLEAIKRAWENKNQETKRGII